MPKIATSRSSLVRQQLNEFPCFTSDGKIVFCQSSNRDVRASYKDLLWLLGNNSFIDNNVLKKKLERTCLGDRLCAGDKLHRGRDYVEVREFKGHGIHVEFHFVTRCYTQAILKLMRDIRCGNKSAPDVIIMNSCVWDITRWGPNGVNEYKYNLTKVMKLFKICLPKETLVIWATTTPMSSMCRGGFLVQQVEFMKHTLRFEVMEANTFARQVVVAHGFDVSDFHYHLRMQIHRRAQDGIHWQPSAVRHMTNLLLTHIALSWDCPLPGNFESKMLERLKKTFPRKKSVKINFPAIPTPLEEKPAKAEASKPTNRTKRRWRKRGVRRVESPAANSNMPRAPELTITCYEDQHTVKKPCTGTPVTHSVESSRNNRYQHTVEKPCTCTSNTHSDENPRNYKHVTSVEKPYNRRFVEESPTDNSMYITFCNDTKAPVEKLWKDTRVTSDENPRSYRYPTSCLEEPDDLRFSLGSLADDCGINRVQQCQAELYSNEDQDTFVEKHTSDTHSDKNPSNYRYVTSSVGKPHNHKFVEESPTDNSMYITFCNDTEAPVEKLWKDTHVTSDENPRSYRYPTSCLERPDDLRFSLGSLADDCGINRVQQCQAELYSNEDQDTFVEKHTSDTHSDKNPSNYRYVTSSVGKPHNHKFVEESPTDNSMYITFCNDTEAPVEKLWKDTHVTSDENPRSYRYPTSCLERPDDLRFSLGSLADDCGINRVQQCQAELYSNEDQDTFVEKHTSDTHSDKNPSNYRYVTSSVGKPHNHKFVEESPTDNSMYITFCNDTEAPVEKLWKDTHVTSDENPRSYRYPTSCLERPDDLRFSLGSLADDCGINRVQQCQAELYSNEDQDTFVEKHTSDTHSDKNPSNYRYVTSSVGKPHNHKFVEELPTDNSMYITFCNDTEAPVEKLWKDTHVTSDENPRSYRYPTSCLEGPDDPRFSLGSPDNTSNKHSVPRRVIKLRCADKYAYAERPVRHSNIRDHTKKKWQSRQKPYYRH